MIGIFDSGWGGLSIYRQLVSLLPPQDYIYIADNAYIPYGNKPVDFLVQRSTQITSYLIGKRADVVVIACNTATAISIEILRSKFSTPIVGIEPAVKPAFTKNPHQPIHLLATSNTLNSQRLSKLINRHSGHTRTCVHSFPHWVGITESGHVSSENTLSILTNDLNTFPPNSLLVLACTHYLFLAPTISKLFPHMNIINPAPAIAKRVLNLLSLSHNSLSPTHTPKHQFFSTGITDSKPPSSLLGTQISVKSLRL